MCRPNITAKEALLTNVKDDSTAPPPSGQYYPRHFYFPKSPPTGRRVDAPPPSPLKNLNDKVESISSRRIKASVDDPSVVVPPHILLHADGALVYPDRWLFLPVAFLMSACYLVALCPSYVALAVGIIALYYESDLYSGVVHIVLDDPKNLGRSNYLMEAIMFQGCLEFQWHHEIPRDIVNKGILASCADLNVLVSANLIAIALVHGMPWRDDPENRLLWSIMGLKLFFGYFGQLNHLMAHETENRRPIAIRALQRGGVMLDQGKHNGHHRTYDGNFCLLGHMDWAVHAIDRCLPDMGGRKNVVWFVLWMSMSVFCLPCVVTPLVRSIAECIETSISHSGPV